MHNEGKKATKTFIPTHLEKLTKAKYRHLMIEDNRDNIPFAEVIMT